ncbi:MAG TPA: YggS family pyridoxal phosphate-dependent enzyme [Gammaproteobacteria bacterium]
MTDITYHLEAVRARVREALIRARRADDDVTIVGVSKRQSIEHIQAAFAAGLRDFGESYVQEAEPKLEQLAELGVVWHFIGRIQSNKTRTIAERFHWVHTLDREKIAVRLDAQRPYYAPPLNVLIQVNQGGEPQKGGVPPARAGELAALVARLPRLRLRGLMTIPPADLRPAESREHFAALRSLAERLAGAGHPMDTLSMGMTADFELAIEAGSTCVRIGTAIFGPRS